MVVVVGGGGGKWWCRGVKGNYLVTFGRINSTVTPNLAPKTKQTLH